MQTRNLSKTDREFVISECQKMIAYNKAVFRYLLELGMTINKDYCPTAERMFDELSKMYFEAEGREDGIRENIIHDLAVETIGELIGYLKDKNCDRDTLEHLHLAYTKAELEGRKLSMYRDINALAEWWLEQHGFFEYKG